MVRLTAVIINADIGDANSHAPHHQVCYVRGTQLLLGHQQADVNRQLLQVRLPLAGAPGGAGPHVSVSLAEVLMGLLRVVRDPNKS